MKKHYFLFAAAAMFVACNQPTAPAGDEDIGPADTTTADTTATAEEDELDPSFRKVWETDTVLTTNESVLYDGDNDMLYVSNISGQPTNKDGVGFISKLSPDGAVKELKWITGLDAPKGMAISDGNLYVTNIDELVVIDIKRERIDERHSVPGAKFLNDVAAHNGEIYFSDSETGKVHLLEDGEVATFAEGRDGINGLAFNNGKLYALDGQGLRHYPEDGAEPEMISDGVTSGDGLVVLDDDTYVASRWEGEIHLVKNGKATKLLDTKDENLNTADIGYIPEENLVLVPTFFGNKVAAYELTY